MILSNIVFIKYTRIFLELFNSKLIEKSFHEIVNSDDNYWISIYVRLIFPRINNFLSKSIDALQKFVSRRGINFFSAFIETEITRINNIFFTSQSFNIYRNLNDNNIPNACYLEFPSDDQHRSNKTYRILPYLPYCIIIHIIFPLTKRLPPRSGI